MKRKDEQLESLIKDLSEGEHANLHAYMLKMVLHPEDYDLNKDRKISPQELKKALEWLIMPKSAEVKGTLHPTAKKSTLAGLELFMQNIQKPITYKQFQMVFNLIKLEHLLDVDRTKKNVAADSLGVELFDDL